MQKLDGSVLIYVSVLPTSDGNTYAQVGELRSMFAVKRVAPVLVETCIRENHYLGLRALDA